MIASGTDIFGTFRIGDTLVRQASSRIGLLAVAREAGVSTATVSNTLNHPHMVAEGTRTKVLAVIKRMEFVPNTTAAALRTGTTRLVGLVLPDITNSFYSAIAKGVAAAADDHRFGVILCNSQDDPDRELNQLQMLAEQRAAGALVVPLTADGKRLARLRSLGTHLVLIDREASEGCSVSIDDVAGGRIAAQHLLVGRVGDLVLVNGSQDISQCRDRRAGVYSAFSAVGRDPSQLVEYEMAEMTIEAGVEAARAILADAHSGGLLPSGVVCTNDQLAIGVIRGFTRNGIRVPEQVAVVGYGDLDIAVDAPIPLTTVEQPKFELGYAAMEMLIAEIQGDEHKHRHSSNVFRPSLVVRESAPFEGSHEAHNDRNTLEPSARRY